MSPYVAPVRHLRRVNVIRRSDPSGLNPLSIRIRWYDTCGAAELFDLDRQAAHLFKHDPYADADDRSVSAWIRRSVDHELEQTSKTA